jgi:hypothetical protein
LSGPLLFITVGAEAWVKARDLQGKFFRGSLTIVDGPYRDQRKNVSETKVTDVHGMLFRDKADKFVIPLAFPRGGALRDSYLKYLEEGLAAYLSQQSPPRGSAPP